MQYAALDKMIAAGVRAGLGDEWVRVGGIKLVCDGSISERTARLTEPYVGRPTDYGILVSASDSQREHPADAVLQRRFEDERDVMLSGRRVDHAEIRSPVSVNRQRLAAGVGVPGRIVSHLHQDGLAWRHAGMHAHRVGSVQAVVVGESGPLRSPRCMPAANPDWFARAAARPNRARSTTRASDG
jgi:hypothetical protein